MSINFLWLCLLMSLSGCVSSMAPPAKDYCNKNIISRLAYLLVPPKMATLEQ